MKPLSPDRLDPEQNRKWWVESIQRQKALVDSTDSSGVAFRLGTQVFAIPTAAVQEVIELRDIHSIPHRRGGILLGLANCRGELLLCVSLAALLGISPETRTRGADSKQQSWKRGPSPSLIVMNWRDSKLGFPADQVIGPVRFSRSSLQPPPHAVEAGLGCAIGLLDWDGHLVIFLDADRLMALLCETIA
jgi:chemotaxis-related protein WspD